MIHLHTIGTSEIIVGERRFGPSSGRMFAFLLVLCAERGHRLPRASLIDLLFPDSGSSNAGHSVRELLYRLRRCNVPLAANGDSIELAADVRYDWRELVASNGRSVDGFMPLSAGLLPAINSGFSRPFEDWLEQLRSEIASVLKSALLQRIAQYRDHASWRQLEQAGRALLALDPLSEEGALSLAEAEAATGSKVRAAMLLDEYIKEVGRYPGDLRTTASILRRRISERMLESGEAGDDPSFTGRDEQVELLHRLWSKAVAGAQQLALIVADPGFGKSRLAVEFARIAVLKGAIAKRVACQPHDVYRPMGGIADLAAQMLSLPGALGCSPKSRILLSELIGEGDEAPQLSPAQGSGPEALFASTLSAVSDLLGAVTEERPVIAIIEDGHWLDATSARALLTLLAEKRRRRLLVLLTSRNRAILRNGSPFADGFTCLQLPPLSQEASTAILTEMLARRHSALPASCVQEILRQAGGNPYYISEFARFGSANPEQGLVLPSIADVADHRLSQLSVEERKVLEATIVLGKNASPVRVASVVGLAMFRLLQSVQELEDRGLLSVVNGRILSGHALWCEAIADRMTPGVKKLLHSNAALTLEAEMKGGPGGSLPWDCAEHWREAGEPIRAATVLRDCARHTTAIGRPSDAFRTLRRALELDLPDPVRLEIVEECLVAAEAGGTWTLVAEQLRELWALRRRLGIPEVQHDHFETFAANVAYNCDLDPMPHVQRLRDCISTGKDEAHRLAASRFLLIIAELNFDRELADFAYRSVADISDPASGRVHLDVIYHTVFGDPVLARQYALSIAGDVEKPAFFRHVLNSGLALFRTGDLKAAEKMFADGYNIASIRQLPSLRMRTAVFMTTLQWHAGRIGDAESWHLRAEDAVTAVEDSEALNQHYLNGLNLALFRGEGARAQEHLDLLLKSNQSGFLRQPRVSRLSAVILWRASTGVPLCTDQEAHYLISEHQAGRSFGQHDGIMLATHAVLKERGRTEQAAALVNEYVNAYRRDGFPPDPRLSQLLLKLGTDSGGRAA